MATHPFASAPEAEAAYRNQPALAPGTEGWWKVWGANVHHVRVGDLVVSPDGDNDVRIDLIDDTFEAKAAPMRRGFITNGERWTIGALCPVVVLRWETHNTLA